MKSIDDSGDTAKKIAEPTEAGPSNPKRDEPDLVQDIERIERRPEPDLTHAQQAAHERERRTSISLIPAAAKQRTDIRGEEEPDTERTERPEPVESVESVEPTEPTVSTEPPHIPPLALRNDGRTLLSVTHLAGADLSARAVDRRGSHERGGAPRARAPLERLRRSRRACRRPYPPERQEGRGLR